MPALSDPLCGEGRDGEPPPRGAPWGAPATSRVAWPLSKSRGLARSSPPGAGRPTEPPGSVGRPGTPGTPATVTQQWPARRHSEKNPLVTSRHRPSHTACVGWVGCGVLTLLRGFSRGTIALITILKGTNSGSLAPAFWAHNFRPEMENLGSRWFSF